jgi:thiamine pyrophosphate-dependent acetolactate synthase large subunit-like protein
VAGSRAFYSGQAEKLLQFSERHSIPLAQPIWDRGIINRPVDTYMGVIGAASGGPRLLPDADCILMAGASSDYRVDFLQTQATIVWDWEHASGLKQYPTWLAEARSRRGEFRRSVEQTGARQAERGTHAVHIIAALREWLPDDAVLLIDGGSIGQWAHQLLCDTRYPSHWLTCGPSGVVGWGIGGAMGARLAYPDRPILLLSGDGAFTFTVAELECAVRQNLPFVAVVADDQGWGITRVGHVRQFGEPISSSLGPIAFDRLAEALGARGIVTTHPNEIAGAIQGALAQPQVTVIHIPVVGGNP